MNGLKLLVTLGEKLKTTPKDCVQIEITKRIEGKLEELNAGGVRYDT